MDIQEKLKFIKYNSYRYKGKVFDSSETAAFFDSDFSDFLYKNMSEINNSQHDLLSSFDFSEIFSKFDNVIDSRQSSILKFLVVKGAKDIDTLLSNMPANLEFSFFKELYAELHSKDNRPFWFSKIASCLKQENRFEFINSSAAELSDDEILCLIKGLYETKDDSILGELMLDERISEIAIQKINAPFFYEMVDELNLSDSLLDRRRMNLESILANHQNYDVNDVKNTFCDLHFHDTLNNSMLDIKTILDFANDDETLRKGLGEAYAPLCDIYTYLSDNNKSFISSIPVIDYDGVINSKNIHKYYSMCQERFKTLVSEAINQDVTENINPRIMMSSSGKEVKVYDIENQTEKQRKVSMLVSTIPCSENAKQFKETYYSDNNGEKKKNRRSCSLINQSKLSSLFGNKKRITMGYEDLSDRVITSATVGDGRTDGNEERFRKPRKIRKSDYSSVDKFVAGTQGHTEVRVNMGESKQVMQPCYILITGETPSQFEIDVASEFQIPIRYVNIEKYEQQPDVAYSSPEDYDYYQFEKKEVQRLKEHEKKDGHADCIEPETLRFSLLQEATQTVKNHVFDNQEKTSNKSSISTDNTTR